MPLEPENLHRLNAAHGYVELGMFLDANEELERIDPDVRHVPEVLALRLCIYQKLERWDLMQVVAKKLARNDPKEVQWFVSWAYATRRGESIEAARDVLIEALPLHPKKAIVSFNLACYECQLKNLEVAKHYLEHTFDLDKYYRLIALNEEDLEPLWLTIGD